MPNGLSRLALLHFLAVFTIAGPIARGDQAISNERLDEPVAATLAGKSFLTIPGDQWTLLWHDEFDKTQLDPTKWTSGLSWRGDDGSNRHHNNLYASLIADDDVSFQDGMLALLTQKTDVVDARGRTFHYTQAFIQTAGKFEFKFGYCEIRAKVPQESGPGLWPAFWMLSGGWPPEDDVAEFWTGRPVQHFHQGYAYRLPFSGRVVWNSRHLDQVPLGFHTYGMEWGPGYQLMNMDGRIRVRVYGAQAPNVPMYLILNSGVTSDPLPTAKTVFPNAFLVNYIRVYKRPAVPTLLNGGFEDPVLAPWNAWNRAAVTKDKSHGGLEALAAPASPGGAQQRVFGLKPATTYELSGWVDPRGDGESRLGVKDYGNPEVWASASGAGYQQVHVRFTTGAHNTAAMIYCFRPTGRVGVAYFDDVAIAAVP
jgi:beta-glucanase (GH16 family)